MVPLSLTPVLLQCGSVSVSVTATRVVVTDEVKDLPGGCRYIRVVKCGLLIWIIVTCVGKPDGIFLRARQQLMQGYARWGRPSVGFFNNDGVGLVIGVNIVEVQVSRWLVMGMGSTIY